MVPVVVGVSGLDAVVIPFPDKMIEDLKFNLITTDEEDLFEMVFVIPVSGFCTDENLLEHRESIYRGMLIHLSDMLFDKFYEVAPSCYSLRSYSKLRIGKYFGLSPDVIHEVAAKVISLTRRDEPYDAFDENALTSMEIGVALTIDVHVRRDKDRRLLQTPLVVESKISMSPKTKKGKKKMFFGLFKSS